MLFPKTTPKKPRRGKENKAPGAASTPKSPGNTVGGDEGFSNESMSIIPSSISLAATAMTSLAQRSAARAAANKSGNSGVSVQNPQPSTSAGPVPSTSADAPLDPFKEVAAAKSKTGKGTKGLPMKGRAKVKETARKK